MSTPIYWGKEIEISFLLSPESLDTLLIGSFGNFTGISHYYFVTCIKSDGSF